MAGRRLGGTLAAAATLLVAGPLTGAWPAQGQPLPTPASDGLASSAPVVLQVAQITPRVPQGDDTLVVAGSLRNTSPRPISGLTVQLLVGGPITSRGSLDQYAGGSGSFGLAPGGAAEVSLGPQPLPPNRSRAFRIAAPVSALINTSDQSPHVYQLGVQAVGSTPVGTQQLATVRTFLPWAPLQSDGTLHLSPTPIAWLWPLEDMPHRAAGPTFRDDALAKELAPNGRLSSLVSAAAAAAAITPTAARPVRKHKHTVRPARAARHPVPVTWVVDPMLLQDAQDMSAGYTVSPPDGRAVAGRGRAAAQSWLGALRGATRAADVVPLSYADVDAAALVRGGLQQDLGRATTGGDEVAQSVLRRTDLDTTVSWPAGGAVNLNTLEALFQQRQTTVVLSDTALPLRSDPGYTPGARVPLTLPDGIVNGLLSDSVLSGVVTGGGSVPSDARLDEQRFLAETLFVTLEQPFSPRPLLIAPDRRWAPGEAYAQQLLIDTGTVPWLTPSTLGVVAESPASEVDRAGLTYTAADRHAELPRRYITQDVARLRTDLSALEAVLPAAAPVAHELGQAILRTESASWRGHATAARDALDGVVRRLGALKSKVRVVSQGLITLTSSSGTVAVTISNDLDQPVRVLLHIVPRQGLDARINGHSAATLPLVVPAHSKVPADFRLHALRTGAFPLTLRLWTPQRAPFYNDGGATTLEVRSTAYGTLALSITGGAFGVLLIAVAVRLTRRWLRARHRTGAGPVAGSGGPTA